MASGKKLTYEMKKFIATQDLDPNEWLYQKNTNSYLQLINKKDNKKIVLLEKKGTRF